MGTESLETRVIVLGEDFNMTSTTLLPNYTSHGINNQSNASGMMPNFCILKPPREPWEEDLGFYLNGVLNMLVITMGLVGNMLTVIVLTNKTMRTSTNCFLMALAIWDIIVLLVTFFLISLSEFSDDYFFSVFPYIVAFIYPLGLVAQTITIWLTVSFTVERYIAVCHPLKAAAMCTIQRARIVIICVCFISLFYNIPRWFEYKVKPFTHFPSNDSCMIIEGTAFSKDPMYHKIYFGWSYFLVMCVIPLLSLAVLNIFLILAVRRSKAQRKDMNVRQSRENNVTIMLIAVVLLFILFQVPALIYNMAYAIDRNATQSFGWKILSSIRNFLVNLNSAVNFILYCALGQKFRRTFVRTFCPLLRKRLDNFQSFSNTYKMDKINKANGATKYVKMGAGKNNHMTTTTGDSGVVTRSAGVSRYSSPLSVSKNTENLSVVTCNKGSEEKLQAKVDKENNITIESSIPTGDKSELKNSDSGLIADTVSPDAEAKVEDGVGSCSPGDENQDDDYPEDDETVPLVSKENLDSNAPKTTIDAPNGKADVSVPEGNPEPSATSEVSLPNTQLTSVANTQPTSVANTQPTSVANTQPTSVANTQPTSVAKTQPDTPANTTQDIPDGTSHDTKQSPETNPDIPNKHKKHERKTSELETQLLEMLDKLQESEIL